MRKHILFAVFILLVCFTHCDTISSSSELQFQTITISDQSDSELLANMVQIQKLTQGSLAAETFIFLIRSSTQVLQQSELRQAYEGVFEQGNLYFFKFDVPFGNKKLSYKAKVLRKGQNQFQVLSRGFFDLPTPAFEVFQGDQIINAPYVGLITQLIKDNLKLYLEGAEYQVSRVQFAVPEYIIYYKSKSKIAKIKLAFDFVGYQVQIKQATFLAGQSLPNGRTFTKKLQVKVQNYIKFGVQKDGITFSDISSFNEASLNGFSKLSQADSQIKTLIEAVLLQLLPQVSQIDNQYKHLETRFKIENGKLTIALILLIKGNKNMVFATLKMPALKKRPTFKMGSNLESLLASVSDVSDPTLIPFLSGTYELTSDSNFLSKIGNYLIDKVGISGDFTILLINQVRYGIRLIIQTDNDKKFFEAVIASDNSNLQILQWRRIARLNDIDPDIFNQYYRITSDENLKALIRKVFNTEQSINKFKEITSAEKKISFDGVYYRIVVESTTGNKYFLKFYYIPEKNFYEIIHYDNMDSGFDSENQKVMTILPDQDKIYNIAKQHVNKKFGSILKDSGLAYIAVNENDKNKFFRLVFVGVNGKYQIIAKVDLEKQTASTVRWEKLEEGYVPADLNRLSGNDQFKAIRNGLKEYINKKFKFDANPVYFQSKNIPESNAFFKFIYTYPLPFVLTLEQRYSDHALFFRGVQRLPIAPAHIYYNDRVFSGFALFPIADLQFDDVYPSLFNLLKTQTTLNLNSYQILAAFRQSTVLGIFFKVIYKIGQKIYLGSFSYTFATKQGKVLSFEPYERKVQAGDYRWNCQTLDSNSGTCKKCQNDFVLTLGRCYIPVYGCILQIAGGCQSCNPGLIRTRQTCASSPQKAIPQPLSSVSFTNQDQNCLFFVDSICRLCAHRYYLSNGVCRLAQDSCKVYDSDGLCSQCYTGYYLSNKKCKQIPPLCKAANSEGNCIECYDTYQVVQGNCYVNSNFNYSSGRIPSDNLCRQWDNNGVICQKCQSGTFKTKKGKCIIKDSYCSYFNEQLEVCEVCQRNYQLSPEYRCIRKRR